MFTRDYPEIPTRVSSKDFEKKTNTDIYNILERVGDVTLMKWVRSKEAIEQALHAEFRENRRQRWARERETAAKLAEEKAQHVDEVEKLRQKLDEYEASNERLTRENIDGVLIHKFQLDDGEVEGRWQALDYKILQVASIRYNHANNQPMPDGVEQLFDTFVDKPEEWLQGKSRVYLFRAYIWSEMVQKVFGDKGTLWAWPRKARITARRMLEQLWIMRRIELGRASPAEVEKTEKQYHDLRSLHTKMAYRSYGIDPSGVVEVATSIETALKPAQVADFDDDECPSFQELVQDAAQLDVELRMCLAGYKIFMHNEDETKLLGEEEQRWPRYGMEFDSESHMEEIKETGLPKVALVVSPALVKVGSSLGRDYDKSQALANRKVICA